MDKNRRTYMTYTIVASALTLVAWAASAAPALHPKPGKTVSTVETASPSPEANVPAMVTVPKTRPRVELVFALDTTGSMSGLLEGAKRKIWSIAHFVAQGQPTPDLRIGLVAYRDKGDEYVTKFYDLSDDIDSVFEHLQTFAAGGGGDTPEHVSKALYDAVYKSSWSGDGQALKIVYLVGDAPPHTDYQDGYDYRAIARHAHQAGIRINTVRCGGDNDTQVVWNEISRAASGEYATIDQSGGMIAVATPFDDKLAALNGRLARTAVGYGKDAGMVRSKVAAAVNAAPEAQASRAGFFGLGGKGAAVSGDGDLVNDVASGRARLEALAPADMPSEMAAMPAPAQKAWIENKRIERERITAEINKVSSDRSEYLKKKSPAKADAFDSKVEDAVRRQAASVGLKY